jgi:hypothetical protein
VKEKFLTQNFCELIFYYTFRTVLTKNIKTLWQKNPLRKQQRKQLKKLLRRLPRRRSNQVQLDTLAKRSDPGSLLFFCPLNKNLIIEKNFRDVDSIDASVFA